MVRIIEATSVVVAGCIWEGRDGALLFDADGVSVLQGEGVVEMDSGGSLKHLSSVQTSLILSA